MTRTNGTVALRRLLGLFVLLALLVTAASLSPACRTATQVTLEIRTTGSLTCAQLKGVAIVVARNPQDAEEKMQLDSLSAQVPRGECGADPKLLGTLVLTPSEGSGAVIVRARISDAPESTCVPPRYRGCIVARRSFAFIEHAAMTLPVSLEIACLDVPCDVVSSCRTGKCVSSEARCSESTNRCDSESEPKFERDGGPILPSPDAEVLVDGGADAAIDAPADARTEDVTTDASADAEPPEEMTNLCPTPDGSIDCVEANAGANPYCCKFQTAKYDCESSGSCFTAYPRYLCLGGKHCPALSPYCCETTAPAPAPLNTCAPSCAGRIFCGVNADCPPGKACSGIVPFSVTDMDASRLYFCQ